MRAFIAAAVAIALGVFAILPATAATQEQLQQAALTSGDLGRGWSVFQEGPAEELAAAGVANYTAIFQRGPSLPDLRIDLVIVSLADETALSQANIDIDGSLGAIRGLGFELREEPAPQIGSETRRFVLSGTVIGLAISGEVIVWRQNGVVAIVGALGTAGGSAEALARQQEERINAVIGY